MIQDKYQKIIQQLTEENLLDKAPIDLEKIAQKYNITVSNKWMGSLSGKIFKIPSKKENEEYQIQISVLHPLVRRRFTLAHELAHYFLHKEEIGDGITEDALYRSGLPTQMEKEANQFAGILLMPNHLLKEEIDNYFNSQKVRDKETLINDLANLFIVSKKSMQIQLGL